MRKRIITLVAVVVLIVCVPVVGGALSNIEAQLNTVQQVFNLINDQHISNVDVDMLAEGAIKGMIETTNDPYTTYFTQEEYNSFIAQVDAKFTGIGIYIGIQDDYVVVQSPITGSPAEEAGIKSGDLIIAVEGNDVRGKSTEEVASLVRGEAGTMVNITVKRGDEEINVDVERTIIQIPNVESKMLTDEIGYLDINTFGSTADSDVYGQLEELKNNGMKKLVIDLRGNGGGYLNSALQMATNFIEKGTVLYVKDSKDNEESYEVTEGQDWNLPTVVLIDGGSASASEILTGILKDYDKATIIGENSFGKGTVQNLMPLENGGYLKLTIREYFTPNKNKINGIGITPDVEIFDPTKQLKMAELYLDNVSGNNINKEDWFTEEGRDYIALKKIVESNGGYIYWNSENKTIDIEIAEEEIQIPKETEGLLFKSGSAYLDKDFMNLLLPEIIITKSDETITIYKP